MPVKIRKIAALVLAAAAALLFPACNGNAPRNAGKKISYHLDADPVTLDPQIAADTPSLVAIRSLYEGLTRLDASGNAKPGVAKTWDANADGTQFTFHLRADAKWSAKKYGSVTAEDFVFAFRRALDPKTGSATCQQMYCIRNARKIHAGALSPDSLGVSAKDAKTLVVDLEYSFPDFPKLASAAVFMPCDETFFRETAGRYGLETEDILGNGPFVIDGAYGWEHGKRLSLAGSGSYAGEQAALPSAVSFAIGGEGFDAAAALKEGTVDAAPVSAAQLDEVKALGCTTVSFEDTTWGLCFNTQSALFKNVKVRTAFAQALDRSAVLSHIPENASAAENILLPQTELNGRPYRTLAGGPFYLKQSGNAAQTLAAGLSELHLENMAPVAILCPDSANAKLMANEMIAAWNKQFNDYFNMEPLAESDLESRVASGDYGLAVCSIRPADSGPLAALSLFTSASGDNPAHLRDPSYDALVAAAEAKSGNETAAACAAAEKYLNERAVFYPLCYEKSYYAAAKGVTGIVFLPFQNGIDFIGAGKES